MLDVFLETMSPQNAVTRHLVCYAPPVSGTVLAILLAREGKKVILFATPARQDKQFRGFTRDIEVIVEDDLETDAVRAKLEELAKGRYDAIIFLTDQERMVEEFETLENEEFFVRENLFFRWGGYGGIFRLGMPDEIFDEQEPASVGS